MPVWFGGNALLTSHVRLDLVWGHLSWALWESKSSRSSVWHPLPAPAMFSHQCSKETKLYLRRESVFSPALQATSRPPQNRIGILCQREPANKQSFQSTPPCIYNSKLCSQELILQFIFNPRFILISGIDFFPEIILNLHFLMNWYIYKNNFFSLWDFVHYLSDAL